VAADRRHGRTVRDLVAAWLAATVFSGLPSTLYALATGADPAEATLAAGAMLLPHETSLAKLVAAAAAVHGSISLFWTLALAWLLPRRHEVPLATLASAAIAILDLKLIAPAFFPAVAALDFWPQFADHLLWGLCLGGTWAFRRTGARLALVSRL
jgi:hypothetical protein